MGKKIEGVGVGVNMRWGKSRGTIKDKREKRKREMVGEGVTCMVGVKYRIVKIC